MKLVILLTASLVIATSAVADTKDMKAIISPAVHVASIPAYFGVEGGADFADYGGAQRNTSSEYDTVTKRCCRTIVTSHETFGHQGVGNDWGGVVGIKGGYLFNPVWAPTIDLQLAPAAEVEGLYFTNDGSFAGFVNGVLNFDIAGSRFTPYLKIGVGVESYSIPNHGGSDTAFAVQAAPGCACAITKNWSVFAEYKYIPAFGPQVVQRNCAVAGISYNF
jgi:opacity protein-like surface antigen